MRWLRKRYEGLNDKEWKLKLLSLFDVPRSRHAREAFPCAPLGKLPTIIHVVPSEPLGGLFSGTLDFRRSKANRLVALGRADMERALAPHFATT
jgi:hypothetical protein